MSGPGQETTSLTASNHSALVIKALFLVQIVPRCLVCQNKSLLKRPWDHVIEIAWHAIFSNKAKLVRTSEINLVWDYRILVLIPTCFSYLMKIVKASQQTLEEAN